MNISYRKIILMFTFTAVVLSFSVSKTVDAQMGENSQQLISIETKQLDGKALALKDYLEKQNSPLQYHSADIIEAADKYGLDWKLVPAISGVESTFGKAIPGGYNGWGWGVYGNQAIRFNSWRDGIFEVSKGLKEKYVDRGLTEPYSMNRIYAASPTWGARVSYFMKDIDNFAKKTDYFKDQEGARYNDIDDKTVGISAKLALKP